MRARKIEVLIKTATSILNIQHSIYLTDTRNKLFTPLGNVDNRIYGCEMQCLPSVLYTIGMYFLLMWRPMRDTALQKVHLQFVYTSQSLYSHRGNNILIAGTEQMAFAAYINELTFTNLKNCFCQHVLSLSLSHTYIISRYLRSHPRTFPSLSVLYNARHSSASTPPTSYFTDTRFPSTFSRPSFP